MKPDKAMCPLPAFGRSGMWRAQLLWMVEGEHADAHAVAAVLGYAPSCVPDVDRSGDIGIIDLGFPDPGPTNPDPDHSSAQRSVRFLYVEHNEPAPPEANSGRSMPSPDWYVEAQARYERAKQEERDMFADPAGSEQRPAHQPLQHKGRFNPFLRRACSQMQPGPLTDMPRVLRAIESGAVLRSLPLHSRMAWASTVHLLLDKSDATRPFHQDIDATVRLLQSLCGHQRVRVAVLADTPSARPWVRVGDGRLVRFNPPAGAPLLILGDLGGDRSVGWRALGVRLTTAGSRATVLCPVLPPYLSPALRRMFRIVDWGSRGAQLRAVTQARPAAAPEVPVQAAELLALGAAAIFLEPALIRALRRLLPSAGAAVERAVWRHEHVRHGSGAAVAFASLERREHYQNMFAQLDPERSQPALEALTAHHAHLPESLRMAEAYTVARLLELTDTVAEQWLVDIAYKRREAPWPGLVHGCARLLARQSPLMWQHNRPLAALWAVENADALRAGKVVIRPLLLDDTDLPFFLDQTPAVAVRRAVVQQIGNLLCLVTKATAHGAVLAEIQLQTDRLRVDVTLTTGETRIVLVDVAKLPRTLLEWSSDMARVSVHGLAHHLHLHSLTRPSWARALGRDEFGLYAVFTVAGITQRCRWICPGTFGMGSPPEEPEREDGETLHEVTLSRGYWLADTACTQALWWAVMHDNPSHFKGDPHLPVENVSWDDVQVFLKQLNEAVKGLEAGLPSEAQWEYACRASTQTPFSFGRQITPEQVNYDGNHPYGRGKKGEFRMRTVPVKSLPPNGWGLYEMHGNVWEWCADWYGEYGSEEQTDPVGPPEGVRRVLRGGSWHRGGRDCRSADRDGGEPVARFIITGFRLAPGQKSGETVEQAARRADGQAQAERTSQAAGRWRRRW
jgi:formylglycine-generating enzyme required for sulfatase activity